MEFETLVNKPVLVFDWGDTVMKVLPQYDGPMALWPEVAEVEGIVEALEAFKDHFTIAMASNAADSDAAMLWKALRRVGLSEYFKAVFTARELGARKPEEAFFRQLESVLDRPSRLMIMIGDDYTVDVLGAKQAGWQSVWYNPSGRAAPGLLPLHDQEITSMFDLAALMQRQPLPGFSQTLAWLLETGTPFNILAHIQLVAALSYQLAVWIRTAGQHVDPLLAHRGAMLHDLAKITSIQRHKERGEHGDHARAAADVLRARGQPELADIADRHMPISDFATGRAPVTWEEKIVHFADKLAEGARLVTPEERFQSLVRRYPNFKDELAASQPHLLTLQDEICQVLELTPEDLFVRLKEAVSF